MDELHADWACACRAYGQYSSTGVISSPYQELVFGITLPASALNQPHERLICKKTTQRNIAAASHDSKKGGEGHKRKSSRTQVELWVLLLTTRSDWEASRLHLWTSHIILCRDLCCVGCFFWFFFCVKSIKTKLHTLFPFTSVEWVLGGYSSEWAEGE